MACRVHGKGRALALQIIFVLIFTLPSFAATSVDPSLKWKTIETEHFSIHYYDEIEDIAYRLAKIAEEVNSLMTKVMKYELSTKTQITLLDIYDSGNGYTTVFPYPSITLYLSDLSSNVNPYKYDNYLRYLFLHEYAHALHLDIDEGSSQLRSVFGRFIFPNSFQPWFLIEGMATYMESHYTKAGRGTDPRWEMMLRMDVLENNTKSIEQAAVSTVKWPMGTTRYLYGVNFYDYLSEKYGKDSVVALAHLYGEYFLSYGVDGAFIEIYKKDLRTLWEEFIDHLESKYGRQKAMIGKLIMPKILTRTGYYNLKPRWSKDGKSIYFISNDADIYPRINQLDVGSGAINKVFEGMVFDSTLALDQAGENIVFSKQDVYKNFYVYNDLYNYNLNSKRLTRITKGERAFDPAVSPDGSKTIFIRSKKGMKYLCQLGLNGEIALTSPETDVEYFSPSFSPDGNNFVVAKRNKGKGQKIVLYRLADGSQAALTASDDYVTEANPTYSPDGKYVLFDSDFDGIVNIYAYEIGTGKVFKTTNVIGGAMMADVSQDGKKLACVYYSSRGFDIAVMDFDPLSWQAIDVSLKSASSKTAEKYLFPYPEQKIAKNPTVEAFGFPPLTKSRISDLRLRTSSSEAAYIVSEEQYADKIISTEVHPYNPIPTLIPKFWVPYASWYNNGGYVSVFTAGNDAVGFNSYLAQINYDFSVKRPVYQVTYVNNQFLPLITTKFTDGTVPYSWGNNFYYERQRSASALFSFVQNRLFYEYDRQVLSFGLKTVNLTNSSSLDALAPSPNLGNLNSFVALWQYSNARTYPYSISYEDGVSISTMIERAAPFVLSDYTYTNVSGSISNFYPLPVKHHVLALSGTGFYSRGEQINQSNFTWRYGQIRGYRSGNMPGNKLAVGSVEYRFPIAYPENGAMYGNLFFDRIWGDLFYDEGVAGFTPFSQLSLKRGLGGEVNFDISSLWGLAAFTFTFRYEKGLDEGGISGLGLVFNLGSINI